MKIQLAILAVFLSCPSIAYAQEVAPTTGTNEQGPALAKPAENLPAKVFKGRWRDDQGGSNTVQFALQDGWAAGRLELWCRRGLTRVDFVFKSQVNTERVYEIVKGSWPNRCEVDSFTMRSETPGAWSGKIIASFPTTYEAN